ncbi:MAG: hypothetical protein COU47_04210 [Candidatus Niyogibacteria bacterium CG10_big_fil_rev_8_21_14_0_10_46_36]|uniref:Type 4 fimbrial biogenesis protein PilX N-terminal domain-containing protein n=1 Tax=Candidatus Niyogibacteria bacterium CG10_big_fil_rev_8_21_14_0_10_46_36 TaxID=1974726 RepID=A0A2H0TCI5_9BACT|nr:MAG: hypothetical protein COU47_04210 [Candidatus Niyogibacteria bacterium CG10_big_fil_rev_8_21_14_0_10_46_36]
MRKSVPLQKNAGIVVVLVIVFGSIFVMLLGGSLGFIGLQHRQSLERVSYAEALEIAEAGVNYYRWHLAHDPEDLQDGTGGGGPYVHEYHDPEGGLLGYFSLEVSGNMSCGVVSGAQLVSTGWTVDHPDVKRTVSVKYVRPTVADFSFLLNDNVWAGADREIKGPYHSNGGIRMDGENNSLVTSSKETWLCTSSFGCNPSQNQDGVFGAGENSDLWRFPVSTFDFNGITVDLAEIKAITQGGGGLYFAPSGEYGYHVILKEDRTIDVWMVTAVNAIDAYNTETGWHDEYSVIGAETFLGNFPVPSDCGAVFVEDTLWIGSSSIESRVNGKITLVSADLTDPNKETDIWINGDVTYADPETDGFVLIAQHNNLIGLQVPDSMELQGVFIAQTGHFGRNHYPTTYSPYHKREKLEIFGSVVSNGRVGTKWTSSGVWVSGFDKRENTYDPEMSFEPPAFLPATSNEYEFKQWEEVD